METDGVVESTKGYCTDVNKRMIPCAGTYEIWVRADATAIGANTVIGLDVTATVRWKMRVTLKGVSEERGGAVPLLSVGNVSIWFTLINPYKIELSPETDCEKQPASAPLYAMFAVYTSSHALRSTVRVQLTLHVPGAVGNVMVAVPRLSTNLLLSTTTKSFKDKTYRAPGERKQE